MSAMRIVTISSIQLESRVDAFYKKGPGSLTERSFSHFEYRAPLWSSFIHPHATHLHNGVVVLVEYFPQHMNHTAVGL